MKRGYYALLVGHKALSCARPHAAGAPGGVWEWRELDGWMSWDWAVLVFTHIVRGV